MSSVAHRASRGVVELHRRRSGSAQNRRGVRDGGRMVVGGWSSADGRRRMVVGSLARRSSRFGTDASPRDVGVHARETLGETRGDANGATRSVARTSPRREQRGLDRRSLVALVVVLVRLRSLVARLVVDTLLQGVGGEAKSHDVRSVGDEARGALDGDADASRASGSADGGWTRAAYAALGSRPRGGRSADPRASARRFAPSERTTASPDDAIEIPRRAREYRAARSTRYARVDRHRSETRDRTSRRSPPRTRVWTGPRPPHSETWRAARATVRLPSVAGRISREFREIPLESKLKLFSNRLMRTILLPPKMNLESQTNGAATSPRAQTLLSRTP